jgi:hypothetical protein
MTKYGITGLMAELGCGDPGAKEAGPSSPAFGLDG